MGANSKFLLAPGDARRKNGMDLAIERERTQSPKRIVFGYIAS